MKDPQSSPTGTAEWADQTLNVARGCRHGCLYCYARAEKLRWGQIDCGADWVHERVDARRVEKGYRKRKGTILFPSAHDITPGTVEACGIVLEKLLTAGNRVLIVTKADGPCCDEIRRRIEPWREASDADGRRQVTWRLSIGCLNETFRAWWEPGAPSIEMRIEVLRGLARDGWQTSVSCEPLLEPWKAVELVDAVCSHVTETIWIGACRELKARTAWCRAAFDAERFRLIRATAEHLTRWQTPGVIRTVARKLWRELDEDVKERLRLKDSYAGPLREGGWRIDGGRVIQSPRM